MSLTAMTILSIVLTISIYFLARKIQSWYPSAFLTPVFTSTAVIISFLLVIGISYESYQPAMEIMTYPLSTATIALAVPIYKHRHLILKHSLSVGSGLVLGTVATILSILLMGNIFMFSDTVIASLSVKSSTVPIAIEIAQMINGDPSLTASFVMATGVIGAMIGPWLLSITRIYDPVARGLAIGTIAHGIGTAEIAREGQVQGAVAGMSMGIAAIFTSIFIPLLF